MPHVKGEATEAGYQQEGRSTCKLSSLEAAVLTHDTTLLYMNETHMPLRRPSSETTADAKRGEGAARLIGEIRRILLLSPRSVSISYMPRCCRRELAAF